MFNYKKISLPMIITIFFSYSTNITELPCASSKYSQCLNCFSYLLPAVCANVSVNIEALALMSKYVSQYACQAVFKCYS